MTTRFLPLMLLIVAFSGCVDELPGNEHADEHQEDPGHEASEAEAVHGGHEGNASMHHAQTGMERPYFPKAQGSVPTEEDAAGFEQVSSIRIVGDEGFRPANGVTAGDGSMGDPYLIEHLYVAGDLWVQDTDACFEIREVYIGGQLSLNWNGICAWVHHNYIYDLRVNENIARDGYATGGILEENEIGYIGQLRHYDGEFRENVVGPMPAGGPFDDVLETVPFGFAHDPRIANIDGFNQGLIHHNTFHGSVDLDFHGHHHGTGFFAPHSHYHGDNETRKMPHDHTARWTSVQFADNLIIDPEGYGLRYDDRGHAGDDRTARSEQEETLDDAHMHRTQVEVLSNTIRGSGMWVDIFNADDKLHRERNDGWLTIQGNTFELKQRDEGPFGLYGPGFAWNVGLRVFSAKEVELSILDNEFSFESTQSSDPLAMMTPQLPPVAIQLDVLRDGFILIQGNEASGFDIAVDAGRFEDIRWRLADNDWGSAKELEADQTVPMPE